MEQKLQDNFRVLLTEAIIKLCQMEAVYTDELRIEGTVCVVSDHASVLIAHFAECIGDTQSIDNESNDKTQYVFKQHIDDGLSVDYGELMLPEIKVEHVPSDDEIIRTFEEAGVSDSLSTMHHYFQGNEMSLNANDNNTPADIQQADVEQSSSGKYQCPQCEKKYRSECRLQCHMKTHCGHQPLSCCYCSATFTSMATLHTHIVKQHGESSNCQPSSKKLESKSKKQQHARRQCEVPLTSEQSSNTEQDKNICIEEMTQADDADSLALLEAFEQRDYEKMTYDAQLLMNDTNIAEDQAVQLRKTEMHSAVKARCSNSENKKTRKATIMQYFEKVHVETLHGIYQYKCCLCHKMFKLRTSLYEHINSHTGKRRYACDQCGDRFVHHSSLHNHVRNKHMAPTQHQGTLRYLCTGCDKRFKFRSQFERHLRSNPNHCMKAVD